MSARSAANPSRQEQIEALEKDWAENPRWKGVTRPYSAEDVVAKAGIEAIYLSGWQVAADANTSESMYPDQSLYSYDSVPAVVRRINNTFKRADEIQCSRGIQPGDDEFIDYFLPIVADAEAGFGGVLRTHGWQGAGTNPGSRAKAGCCKACS